MRPFPILPRPRKFVTVGEKQAVVETRGAVSAEAGVITGVREIEEVGKEKAAFRLLTLLAVAVAGVRVAEGLVAVRRRRWVWRGRPLWWWHVW